MPDGYELEVELSQAALSAARATAAEQQFACGSAA
jgi:hypothetical protein